MDRQPAQANPGRVVAQGRSQTSDFDLNIWAFVAIDEDRKRAIDDARGTVAFYASMAQYEKYFAAHGFGAQARAAFEAAKRNDTEAMVKAIPDEMVTTFAPASPGSKSSSVTIFDNASNANQVIQMQGVGK